MDNKQIQTLLEQTITQAQEALSSGNYPIGSVLTNEEGTILGMHQNETYTTHDITAHAEIACIRAVDNAIIDNNSDKKQSFLHHLSHVAAVVFLLKELLYLMSIGH
jgi:tRNA(Arg) A34 adenosine deaminase TadA